MLYRPVILQKNTIERISCQTINARLSALFGHNASLVHTVNRQHCVHITIITMYIVIDIHCRVINSQIVITIRSACCLYCRHAQ